MPAARRTRTSLSSTPPRHAELVSASIFDIHSALHENGP